MDRKQIKTLLELATSFEKADSIMKKYTPYKTDEERTAFLEGMFDCRIVGRRGDDPHTDYVVVLTSIVEKKWRGL